MSNAVLRLVVVLAGGLALLMPAGDGLAGSASFDLAQASGFSTVPRPPVPWIIERRPEAVSLKGEEDSGSGMTRFVIRCGRTPPLVLVVTFDAGDNAQQVMTLRAVSLVADSERPQLEEMRRVRSKQLVTLTYRLDDRMVAAIRKAERVGIQLQTTFESVFFHGFDSMPFEGGAAKWPEFMSACEQLRAAKPARKAAP